MSYQVLARKWRPRDLDEVVGQQHVVQTLAHALDNDRLHHAFLFAGTRGVGKTTLARILAKALNCEKGVSSSPCNECPACAQIDEGRFIDLIEVDAASRTKVEDTRSLLDNVQYAPSTGRFKVYLIDEVHMLSGHSFNALLKTLEEPPEHVKFLLATTDPQKLPVTVLSRCIQFNLRALDVQEISDQLSKILEQESVAFEPEALTQVARQAHGSMRDGLSIIDQAISFSDSNLTEESVRGMLGMITRDYHVKLIDSLARHHVDDLMDAVADIGERGSNYQIVLDELLLTFHKLALLRTSESLVDKSNRDFEQLSELAKTLSDADIQLFYQIGLIGKRDLPLAPDPRTGFEMIMLRMLAFVPDSSLAAKASAPQGGSESMSPTMAGALKEEGAPAPHRQVSAKPEPEPALDAAPAAEAKLRLDSSEDWIEFADSFDEKANTRLELTVSRLSFIARTGNTIELATNLDAGNVMDLSKANVTELQNIISDAMGEDISISLVDGSSESESLAQRDERAKEDEKREQEKRIAEARKRIESEDVPRFIMSELGGSILETTIQPAPTGEARPD